MDLEGSIDIGSRIKDYRKAKGINQTFMAEHILGINRSTYSNYENNFRTPDLDTVVKIAEALEIDVSELLGVGETVRGKFESGFNLKDFDPYIIKIFNDFKERLIEWTSEIPARKITNALIMQNMIIDYLARYEAEIKSHGQKVLEEFTIDADGTLFTGKDLYDKLFELYYEKFMTEIEENSLDALWHFFKTEDLEDPSTPFIKMIDQHIQKFGERRLPLQMVNISRIYKDTIVYEQEEGD